MRPGRRLCAAVIAPLLAACVPGGGSEATKPEPLARVAFHEGRVVVAGPPGYCVDAASVRRRPAARFAVLAACAHLGDTPVADARPAVITVSILPHSAGARLPDAGEMASALASLEPLRQIDGDGLSLVQLARGGSTGVPGGDPRHWRASMVVDGHLVGLAAYGAEGSTVTGDAGRDLLIGTAAAIRTASVGARRAATAGDAPAPATPRRTGGLRSALSGLFRNPA